MRVKIGPYPSRLNATFYADYMTKKYGYDWPTERDQTKFERCLDKLDDFIQACYRPINYFLDGERNVKVKIDRWDTWSMDHTLAYVVLPMLKQLKDSKQGAPHVDKEDVPEALWPNEAEEALYAKDGQTDIHFFARWDYVMDEMIFAFESKLDDDWEEQFYSGESDHITVPVDEEGNEVAKEDAKYFEWRKGPNDTFEIDWEGRKAYQERISNGFRLFGKYYEALWD